MTAVFVMTTDHGTHSAEQWADMMSLLVFPISPEIAQHKMLAAKQTQLSIAQALSSHFDQLLTEERDHLEKDAAARLGCECDGHVFVDEALNLIYDVTDKTEWKDYMRSKEDALAEVLVRNFDSAQHVERMWHATTNEHEAAMAYRAKFGV